MMFGTLVHSKICGQQTSTQNIFWPTYASRGPKPSPSSTPHRLGVRLDSAFTESCVHHFFFFFFFFCFHAFKEGQILLFRDNFYCLYTVLSLFIVYTLKNIKNRSHDTIYTFKNYFATVFSVFSFQFQQQ